MDNSGSSEQNEGAPGTSGTSGTNAESASSASSVAASATAYSSSVQSFDSSQINPVGAKSLTSSLSRVHTVISASHIVQSLHRVVTDVHDDNLQTELNAAEAGQTDLGRILSRPDFYDAMKVATHVDPRSDELANVMPDDERAVRKLTAKAVAEEIEVEEEENYPPVDKGYAWAVCFAEFLAICTTWGSTTSFGVFISYWLNNNTFVGADPLNYALSSSITVFLAQALAPVSMILFNMIGLKLTVAIGVVFHFAGFLLCSYSTKLWELYCTQGLILGFGFSLVFNPSIIVLSGWFLKYRGLSSGIVVCGAGAGGMVFTLAAQALITQKSDFRWAMRMLGLTTLGLNLIVLAIIKERIPVKRERSWKSFRKQFHVILNWRVMKRWHVIALTFWFAMGIVSYIVITFSLASFATFIGLSEVEGSHVTAIFNACQAVGRVCIGAIGDRYGRINTAVLINIFVIIIIFAFFINCSNFPTLLGFSIVSGLVTGWCQLLNQAIMPDSVPMADFPSVWSYENIIVGCFCLFSEVVALKLRTDSTTKPFLNAQLFAGFMVVGSLICLVPVREWKIRRMLTSRLEDAREEQLEKEQKKLEDPVAQDRIQRYELLLQKTAKGYLYRLFYPMKA
ncbi:DEKNAAC102811 [Brettanomyces naardenensis]|uniref:DEKNAAC102811 n=1 Tax=Brettanomyces naardenensis TaxID=13370 RepID=A0A448YM14_BRENA|nr:DEKNAAC102811 [Brettanomyces naardenensis]